MNSACACRVSRPLPHLARSSLRPRCTPRPAAVLPAFKGGSGDIVLQCPSGDEVKVFSQILLMTSPVLEEMLAASGSSTAETGKLQVEGSKEAWHLLLAHLYPTYPRPAMTLESAALMLPLAQQYNVLAVLAEINAFLSQQFPEQLSSDPKSARYILKWLKLADDLQLETLRKLCMLKLRNMAIDKDKQLEQALIADVPTARRPIKVKIQPPKPKPLHYASRSDIVWCNNCQDWRSANSYYSGGSGGGHKLCDNCRQPILTETTYDARWFPSDEPKLLDSIKRLSRDTVDDLLATMVVVCSGNCSKEESAA